MLKLVLDEKGQLVSKTDQVRQHMRNGDLAAALRIAKTFKLGLTDEQQAIIRRGHEVVTNPGFYAQIGRDVVSIRMEALALMGQLYR